MRIQQTKFMANIFSQLTCKNFVCLVAILIAGFFSCQSVLAQSSSATTTAVVSAQIVATVEIYSAKIVGQQGNQFNLSFDFFNQKGVQPGIKYAVQLLKIDSNGSQALVDEFIYPEIIDLKEGETKKMAISYTAPAYSQGEFSLWLAAKNSSGLPLAFSSLGKVALNRSGQFVEIIPETCFLTIEGSAGNKKYPALQVVSVKPEENLIVSCQAINHFSQSIRIAAQFQTFLSTSFGDEVVVEDAKQDAIIELSPNQQKEISFYLPKLNAPQVYETKFWLMTDSQPVSNKVVLRYAVAGQSATIENIILDKEFYQKGEIAQIQFLWSAVGNQSAGQISFIIKDQQAKPCSDAVNQSLNQQASFLTLAAPIIRDCHGPKIEAVIKDQQGNILDSQTLSVTAKPAASDSLSELWRGYKKIIFGAVAVLVLLLVLLITIRRKKLGKTVSLFFILGFVIFFNFLFFSEAKAFTYTYSYACADILNNNEVIFNITYTVSLDKSTYSPSETLTAYATANYVPITCVPTLNYSKLTFRHNSVDVFDLILTNGVSSGTYSTHSVGTDVGDYTSVFTASWSSSCGAGCATGESTWAGPSYTIVAPPTDCIQLGSLGCSSWTDCCATPPAADTCQGASPNGKCCITSSLITCSADSQCCDGHCNNQNKCGPDVICVADGLDCPSSPGYCCNGCNGNKCGPVTCTANGYACPSSPGYCCNTCNQGTCSNISTCPDPDTYCPANTPLGHRVYDDQGHLCQDGHKNTCYTLAGYWRKYCPEPSDYCPDAIFFNDCGVRLPQGIRNCYTTRLGYVSVQGNSGPIKLSLVDMNNPGIGAIRLIWKAGQPSGVASLVPIDGGHNPEASPVRVQTNSGPMAWRKWWPNNPAPPSCLFAGAACNYPTDCCNQTCSGGLCVCKSNNTDCVKDVECCTGYCPVASKVCACKNINSACRQDSQCCSGSCDGIRCCLPAGASCVDFNSCCSRSCGGIPGATTCQ